MLPSDIAAALHHEHATAPYSQAAPPPSGARAWDVQDYTYTLRIDPDHHRVDGTARITLDRVSGGAIRLDVAGFTVTDPMLEGVATHGTVAGDSVSFPDPGSDHVVLTLAWTKTGSSPDSGGLYFDDGIVWTTNEPSGARTWLPCVDDPSDKATLHWDIAVPAGLVVAANGDLDATDTVDGWTTYSYRFDLPIPTYLIALHVSDYELVQSGDTVAVWLWVRADDEAQAVTDLASTPEILDVFADIYGPYPWTRYGNAIAPLDTGMENTTVTTFGGQNLGTDYAEILNAHEAAHHWVGDSLTPGDWPDIWLNEGFATYSEALWYEHLHGAEGLHDYMAADRHSFYLLRGVEGVFPVASPDVLFGPTVYLKGGWVLHMLRGVVGDAPFFELLHRWATENAYGTVDTAGFEALAEEVVGDDLSWFFDPWLYGTGEPTWAVGWTARHQGHAWQLDLGVTETGFGGHMPTTARVTYADGSTADLAVEIGPDGLVTSSCSTTRPTAVTLDPDGWVLTEDIVDGDAPSVDWTCDGGDTGDGDGDGDGTSKDTAAGCGCDPATGAESWGAVSWGAGALATLAWGARRRRAKAGA